MNSQWMVLVMMIFGCFFKWNNTDPDSDNDDLDPDNPDTAISESDTELDRVDDDGDGFSEADGDCNDADSATHPNADDALWEDRNCDDISKPHSLLQTTALWERRLTTTLATLYLVLEMWMAMGSMTS